MYLLKSKAWQTASNPVKIRGKERAKFKEMLDDLLSTVPDTLTVDEVAELTGYHRRTILRYVQRKYIYAVNLMGKYYISKSSIISYLATDKAFKNTQKSEWHKNIIWQFTN
jgi:excisionase family DNA binding protein